jgi:hypothetical protein
MIKDDYKKMIKESILEGMISFNGGGITEKLDPHVDELAGAMIAAGPQKVADVISKMDQAVFAEFCNKIDAQGILLITKQFSNTQPTQQPVDQQNQQPQQQNSTPESDEFSQELTDL